MRLDIKVDPHHICQEYEAWCDGVKLERCTMADEEMGCAEVQEFRRGRWQTDEWGNPIHRIVWGKIELRPVSHG